MIPISVKPEHRAAKLCRPKPLLRARRRFFEPPTMIDGERSVWLKDQ
jgi:hypothetical protein